MATLLGHPSTAANGPHRALAVISIDGMHPDNVLKADQFNLKIPNLRRYSAHAFAALEEIDKMVGEIEAALRQADPRAAVCVVSDHGFAAVDHQLNLNVALVKAGLLKLNAGGTAIEDWKAQPWLMAGSAAIILKDPADAVTRAKVEEVLRSVADPANGVERVLDRKAIAAMGGTPTAAFWLDMKSNFALGGAFTGPLVREISRRGTHGFAPTHPELQASFFVVADGADLPPLPVLDGAK